MGTPIIGRFPCPSPELSPAIHSEDTFWAVSRPSPKGPAHLEPDRSSRASKAEFLAMPTGIANLTDQFQT
jgi:hypothetical protein